MNKIIFVDIDLTICKYSGKTNIYPEAIPIKENIDKINKLYDDGNKIVFYSLYTYAFLQKIY